MHSSAAGAPFRITLVTGQLTLGGQERFLFLLLQGLDRRRFDPDVVSLDSGGYWADRIRSLGLPVLELPRWRHGRLGRLLRFVKHLRERRPVLLYSLGFAPNTYGRIAGRLAGVPHLVTGWRLTEWSPVHRIVEILLERSTDCVVGNSEAVRQNVVGRLGVRPEKVVVIQNGVEPVPLPDPAWREAIRAGLGVGPSDLLVGTVARLSEGKNLAMLIDTARRVRAVKPGICFVLVGGGPWRSKLEAMQAPGDGPPAVHLLGERADARALMPCFDVFALTSNQEGMPNAVLEAMAAGVPCVTTSLGGCREVVAHGDTGFLVSQGDARAMAAHILELARSRELRTAMGRKGRLRATEQFSVEKMIRAHETLFAELIG